MITKDELDEFMRGLRDIKKTCDEHILEYPKLKIDRQQYRDLEEGLVTHYHLIKGQVLRYPPMLMGFEILVKD